MSGKGVVNLKQNLNLFEVVVDIFIPSIDEACDGALRNPSNCLIKDGSFNSIEEILPVSEYVFNVLPAGNLSTDILLPTLDFGELAIVPFLDSIDFLSQKPNTTCEP